jgi:hypothetical protein
VRLLVGLERVAGDWLVWLAWNGSWRELRSAAANTRAEKEGEQFHIES